MAWDADRPVPWQRLIREWFLYVGIMLIVFIVFFRERALGGIVVGLLASGPMYLAFGYISAKLGYRRKSFKELRDEPRRGSHDTDEEPDTTTARPKPAPTKRTGGGTGRPGGSRRRRR